MELGYAFFILILYVVLVILGVWAYEYWEKQKNYQKPVAILPLTQREKRGKLNELVEPLGLAYDGRQDVFYSRVDGWQRKYGYQRSYDEGLAPLNMVVDCEPIFFEYEEKRWLLALWKGQYGIAAGGAVGLYYQEKRSAQEEFFLPQDRYQAVKEGDTLRIKSILRKNGKQLFFRRGYHWCLAGFVLGEFSPLRQLEMDVEITLKDREMRDALLQGLYQAGYSNQEFSVLENTVWIHFTRPHTTQPYTKSRLFSGVKQLENKKNCRIYRRITREYGNVYDKVLALQQREPGLYKKMEHMVSAGFLEAEAVRDKENEM